MESLILEVERRTAGGKGPARRARSEGRLPGVFYGPGAEPTPLAMDCITFDRQVRGLEGTQLIQLKSADGGLNGKMVLVRDLQEHPVTGASIHVDLLEVPLDRAIEVSVPLHFVGKAEGVTLGGILQPILRELVVSCLPTHIPQSIDVDVSSLGIHQSLHVEDLVLPEGAKPVATDNPAVVSVQPPTVSEQPAGPEAAEGIAPEAGAAAAPAGEAPEGGDKS